MKGGKQPWGYTIIEVLIVMAVSGLMFVISANFINGKQERASFEQGSNQFASAMRGVIDEVVNGEYSDVAISCDAPGGTVRLGTSSPTTQGKNQDCVFLGKAVHLRLHGDKNKYEVFSLATARLDSAGKPVTDINSADIKAIARPGADLTKTATVPQGIEVTDAMTAYTPAAVSDFGFAITQGLGSTQSGTNTYYSGSQSVSLFHLDFQPDKNTGYAVGRISIPNAFKPATQICIPITDGTRGAIVLIGSSGSQINVELKQLGKDSTPSCP